MRFCFGKFVSILCAAALIFICSCEKHRVGEIPEVQKEHVDPATAHEEGATEPTETSTSATPPAKPAPPTPTPADFFPKK
ncbi:MAG: hypothetical protein ABI925_04865 [Verrucomicrobiota bacterium]